MTGQDILNKAIEHLGEDYIYGTRVPLDDPNWHGPWDCAEFVTWVVKQVTGKTYGVTEDNDPWTGAWQSDVESGLVKQCPSSKAIRTPGAILLKRSNGVRHIVFSVGDGRTIGAQNHRLGVEYLSASIYRWDWGILIPGVTYEGIC